MECGLRERKKRATRHALSEAALRLALDKGIDHLTVEEISEAAGVSARTFFNYFSSKEQALLGDESLFAEPERINALIRDSDSVLDGLYRVAMASVANSAGKRDQVRMRWQLMERSPALLPRLFAKLDDQRDVLAAAVAARTGASPGDAYPQLMAGVAFAAMRVAIVRWTAGHGDYPPGDHVNEVFGLLRNELEPAGTGTPRTVSRGAVTHGAVTHGADPPVRAESTA